MAADAPNPATRRPRKRRRRAASYSTSSSEDDSSDDDSSDDDDKMEVDAKARASSSGSSSSSSSSSGSDSESSDSSDSESSGADSDSDEDSDSGVKTKKSKAAPAAPVRAARPRGPTLSPSPPPREIPSFLPAQSESQTDDRRAAFKRLYMDKLVEGFGGDLEQMRAADPTLGPARLQLLIDSLAAGVDVFADKDRVGVDEVGVILNSKAE